MEPPDPRALSIPTIALNRPSMTAPPARDRDQPAVKVRYDALRPALDERARRLLLAAESQAFGPGGISAVSKTTGVSRRVIRQGLAELKEPAAIAPGRILASDHPRLLESMIAYAGLLRATRRRSEAKRLEAYVGQRRKNYLAENPTVTNTVDVHSLMQQNGH
jgi:hypothetical protein